MIQSQAKKKSKEDAPRAIGRPATDSSTVGREALVEATCELFKEMPPRLMTRAQVARLSGVDPSLIRYYFKNVHVLLIEAAKLFNQKYIQKIDLRIQQAGNDPVSRLKVRIGALIDLIAEYPYYPRLVAEVLLESENPDALILIEWITKGGMDSYASIVEEGIAQGIFRRVDPKLLFTTVIGLAEFQTTAHALINLPQHKGMIDSDFRDTYKDYVVELVLQGLRP